MSESNPAASATSRRRVSRSHSRALALLGSAGVGLVSLVLLLTFGAPAAFAAGPRVRIEPIHSYGIMASSTITNTGPTLITGSLALSPGSSVTGAPVVTGTQNIANPAAVTAKTQLNTAYTDAANAPSTATVSSALDGQTLTAGVYTSPAIMALNGGDLTLSGDSDDVFIFQVGSALNVDNGSRVLLTGGVRTCNVFWQVSSTATLNAGTQFVGTIMALTDINMLTGATLRGRALAREGQVTLDTNTITRPSCITDATGVTSTATPTPGGGGGGSGSGAGGSGSGSGAGGSGSGSGLDNGTTTVPEGHPETGEGGAADSRDNLLLLGGGLALGGAAFASTRAIRRPHRSRHSYR